MPTEEFLKLLRQDNYLAVLQWVSYLKKQLQAGRATADDLLTIAIYELINHGFNTEDQQYVVRLTAIIEDPSRPMKGEMEYAATLFASAAVQCLAYAQCNMLNSFKHNQLMDSPKVSAWMGQQTKKIPEKVYGQVVKSGQDIYNLVLLDSRQTQVEAIIQNKIFPLTRLQTQCIEYRDNLTKLTGTTAGVRLGLVCKLIDYLMTQIMLTPECQEEVVKITKLIRNLEPQSWEEVYLQALSPQTISLSQTLAVSCKCVYGFFKSAVIEGWLLEEAVSDLKKK